MIEKKINISSLSQLTLCGIVFIFLFLISGCFLQKGNDAAAELAMLMLFPTESDEKTEPCRLMDVYEVRGLLTKESSKIETKWGGIINRPYLELDVEEVIKIESKDKGAASPVSTKNEYLKLSCLQVSDDVGGIYDEWGETTKAALDKKVSIQGAIYRCGDNWNICDNEILLMNFKTDEISTPK